jgi:hypothetical protein
LAPHTREVKRRTRRRRLLTLYTNATAQIDNHHRARKALFRRYGSRTEALEHLTK